MGLYPNTTSDRMEPLDLPEPCHLCDTCAHAIEALGINPALQVCVEEHDEDGEPVGTVVSETVEECDRYKEAEE